MPPRRAARRGRLAVVPAAVAVVLEMVPAPVAAEISARLRVPTIGIGAGGGTGGQVQVWHDLLGLYDEFVPKFSRQFLQLGAPIRPPLPLPSGAACCADGLGIKGP